jgi:hypothetical protein
MSQANQNPTPAAEAEESHLKSLYLLGGIAALGMILVALLDIVLTFVPGGESPAPVSGAALEWFALYKVNWFMGLRGLGFFNIFTTSLVLVTFFALYKAHQRVNKTYAALALIVLCLASAIYIANNRSLPMLTLSAQYNAASTQAQKDVIVAAGMGLLAQAEDFTPGTFLGFFLSETAGMIMSLVLLRGKIFSKLTAWICLMGYAILIVYSLCVSFTPENFDPFLFVSMIGGLLSMAGYFLIAKKLFALSRAA